MNELADNPQVSLVAWRIKFRDIIRQLAKRLVPESAEDAVSNEMKWVQDSKLQPIALNTSEFNVFYESDLIFWRAFLGPYLKYSASFFWSESMTLEEAEKASLEDYIKKADLKDGQDVLDLGCGHGSTTLYFAERFPNSHFTAFSLSEAQIAMIREEIQRRNLKNITLVVGDMATHDFADASFDRVIVIEVLEYVLNFEALFTKISNWLRHQGLMFTQTINHHSVTFDEPPEFNGILDGSRYLSALHFMHFQKDLTLRDRWWFSGTHISRTAEAWLENYTSNEAIILPYLEKQFGVEEAPKHFRRRQWQLASESELFAYDNGNFMGSGHYVFEKTKP